MNFDLVIKVKEIRKGKWLFRNVGAKGKTAN